jgi:hypothetical protein
MGDAATASVLTAALEDLAHPQTRQAMGGAVGPRAAVW